MEDIHEKRPTGNFIQAIYIGLYHHSIMIMPFSKEMFPRECPKSCLHRSHYIITAIIMYMIMFTLVQLQPVDCNLRYSDNHWSPCSK